MNRRTTIILDWAIPLVLLAAVTVGFWTSDIDLAAERPFWQPDGGWVHKDDQPWHGLYKMGVIPAWIVALSALAMLIASRWVRKWKPHRRVAALLAIVMIVGPGLLVNTVFKDNWGRPRPLDVYEFGGDRDFVQVWVKSPSGNGNSFASGHASMGFFLLTPFFFLRRRSMGKALFFLGLGLAYGSVMGLARMIQGAHFLSDVVWAAGLVYLTGLSFYYILRLDR